jgi:hypothetical protein
MAQANLNAGLAAIAERDALKADAERYRWLRGGKARTTGAPKAGRIEVYVWEDRSEGRSIKGEEMDAEIDFARAALIPTETKP